MIHGCCCYEAEGIFWGWTTFFSGGALDVFLTIVLPGGGGRCEKTEEEHRLYVHDDERIRAALKGAEMTVLDAETFKRASGRSLRKLYICKKVKA